MGNKSLMQRLLAWGNFSDATLHAKVDRILRNQDTASTRQFITHQKVNAIMAKLEELQPILDEILANARAEDTELDSVEALIKSLDAKISELLAGGSVPPETEAKIKEIFELMKKNRAQVANSLQRPGAAVIVDPDAPTEPVVAEPTPSEPTPTEPTPPADTPAFAPSESPPTRRR